MTFAYLPERSQCTSMHSVAVAGIIVADRESMQVTRKVFATENCWENSLFLKEISVFRIILIWMT
jgi:hypothetical protein